jgi:arylsulfatase A-like enzyme
MNIVLVVFDSLRKDCIGAYGEPPWGKVRTPHLDALAAESLVMTRAFPESLPTLPTRRALYTGRRAYPFDLGDFRLKGDFVGAPGWGPIPEDQPTLAETLKANGYRTGLISDVYHMFKPSKNYWRGFDQWTFLRGQEVDPQRSGPELSQEEIDHWLPSEMRNPYRLDFIRQCLKNMHDRTREEDYFNARVMMESVRWLEQNRDAEQFCLVVECFDPHEPWFVPDHYRKMYDQSDGREQVLSAYGDVSFPEQLVRRTRANYSGLVTMCDRWFGYLYEAMRAMGLLDNTLLVVTSDHGHSLCEKNYIGKRGYPSSREVYDIPLFVRHPEGIGAGRRSDLFLNHTDMAATILELAQAKAAKPIDGRSFWRSATADAGPIRDHVTVAWGTAITVIDDRWWLNCKIDGGGPFLYDLARDPAMERNVGDDHPEEVKRLYRLSVEDAGGDFPAYLKNICANDADAPGCSALAARD